MCVLLYISNVTSVSLSLTLCIGSVCLVCLLLYVYVVASTTGRAAGGGAPLTGRVLRVACRVIICRCCWRACLPGASPSRPLSLFMQCVEAGDTGSYLAGTREAALHAAAGRHPNLVPLLDAFEHRSRAGRHAVLVTEPAGQGPDPLGPTLAEVISLGGAVCVCVSVRTAHTPPTTVFVRCCMRATLRLPLHVAVCLCVCLTRVCDHHRLTLSFWH